MATQQRQKGSTFGSILSLGLGTIGGVLLNDIYEITKAPGFYQTVSTINGIGIGVDDLVQTGIGGILAILPSTRLIGLGVIIGTWLTKLGEMYNSQLQIIPHTVVPPTAGFAGSFYGQNTGDYFGFPASPSTNSAGSYANPDEVNPYSDAMIAVGD